MAAIQIKTFIDIINSVIKRCKIATDDTDSIEAIKEFINTRYRMVVSNDKWKWLQEDRDINFVPKYTTGTVTVVNNDRTVTGVGTAFTDDFKYRKICIAGSDEVYQIISVVNSTTLNLASNFHGPSGSSLSYTIYKDEYGLFPDLSKINYIWHDHYATPLTPVSPREMNSMYLGSKSITGKAKYYTMYGYKPYDGPSLGDMVLGYDFLGAGVYAGYSLKIFPAIDTDSYSLHINYTKKITPLENDNDEPLIPENNRQILLFGALADWASLQSDFNKIQIYERMFDMELRKLRVDVDDTDSKSIISVDRRWWNNRKIGTRYYSQQEVDL